MNLLLQENQESVARLVRMVYLDLLVGRVTAENQGCQGYLVKMVSEDSQEKRVSRIFLVNSLPPG